MGGHKNGQAVIFCSYGLYLSTIFFFPRIFLVVGDWMSTIISHNDVALVQI